MQVDNALNLAQMGKGLIMERLTDKDTRGINPCREIEVDTRTIAEVVEDYHIPTTDELKLKYEWLKDAEVKTDEVPIQEVQLRTSSTVKFPRSNRNKKDRG